MLSLLQREVRHQPILAQIGLLEDPRSLASFQELCDGHGVLGLVLTALDRTPSLVASLSDHTRDTLLDPLHMLRRRAALWDLERDRVLHTLRAAGIDPILLKGGALRLTVYSDSTERTASDLDFLCEVDEVDTAVDALESVGYVRAFSSEIHTLQKDHHFHYVMHHRGGFTVEVHWGLTQPAAAHIRLDADLVRQRAVSTRSSQAIRVPTPEDMVLHMVSQNLEDGFARLQRLVDLDRIVSQHRGFDWDYLASAADRGGALPTMALSLTLSQRLLGTEYPFDNITAVFPVPAMARASLVALRPLCGSVQRRKRGYHFQRELLSMWAGRGSRSWLSAIMDRLSLEHYRFWAVETGTAHRPTMRWRLISLTKLLAFQAWAYLTALPSLLTAEGRDRLRLWSHSTSA